MGSGIFYPAVAGDDGVVTSEALVTHGGQYWLSFGKDTSNSRREFFVRFPSVTIPQGVTITSAFMRCTSFEVQSVTVCNVIVHMNDVDNAVAPNNLTEFDALDLTLGEAWSAVDPWTDGTAYDSPDIKTKVEAVVGRGGWVSGQALMVVVKDNGSDQSARRSPSSFAYSSGSEKVELHVEWAEPSSSSLSSSSLSSSSSSRSSSSSSSSKSSSFSSSSRSSSSSSSSSRSSSSSSSSRSSSSSSSESSSSSSSSRSSSSSSSRSSSSSSSFRSSSSSSSSSSSRSSSSSSKSLSSSSSSSRSSSSSSSSKSSSSSSISLHRFNSEIQLDIEIIKTSHIYGYIRDWRGHIVRKVCSIIATSTDGSTFYGKTTSDPVTGYFYLRVQLANASEILLTSYYEGTYRGQINIAGSEIVTTVSSSSSRSSSSSSSLSSRSSSSSSSSRSSSSSSSSKSSSSSSSRSSSSSSSSKSSSSSSSSSA